uniref:Serum/glucocorticoid regulated kinase 2a n=1 Tax=Nothobranchius furzeri TaxID=105023 RepID=A0A8C6PWW4_NOTFU
MATCASKNQTFSLNRLTLFILNTCKHVSFAEGELVLIKLKQPDNAVGKRLNLHVNGYVELILVTSGSDESVEAQKNIMAERNVLLKSLKHPFLVRLHYSFQTAEKLYFVLDYVNGGELFFHLQRERCFSEPRARFYAAEVASAIGYLHSLNIVYRDLKPENILLDSQGHVVLTDFGLCKEGVEPEGTTSTFCGTPEYLAPEILRKEPYDRTVDWWCLGAVLYEMIYSLPPFYSRDVGEMYDGILHKPLPLPAGRSEVVCSLLVGLLQKDQHRRLGAIADFLEIKNHPFFTPINWDDLYHKRITPPYNPNVRGPADTQHIDPEFTREMVPNSVGRTPELNASTSSSNAFNGFSFVGTDDGFL